MFVPGDQGWEFLLGCQSTGRMASRYFLFMRISIFRSLRLAGNVMSLAHRRNLAPFRSPLFLAFASGLSSKVPNKNHLGLRVQIFVLFYRPDAFHTTEPTSKYWNITMYILIYCKFIIMYKSFNAENTNVSYAWLLQSGAYAIGLISWTANCHQPV